ncbi:hypothetical protein A5660_25060 [Mycobacterium alsense]|uniref:HK97 family phage prohead protease n=1 Tax=Mycobacterium alsense TaxID=324058 RepID=UPI0007FF2300|nr:HK97 family phage prohead protease [Mycobacterium alsense]OBJ00365.1 hypothetical protein A5660_25060 [Mycobacterium alsense]
MAISEKPWDGSSARFTIDQWRRSCLIHRDDGDPNDKATHSLPVREPDGRLSRAALSAAAARLGQVQGISSGQRASAARALLRLYGEAGLAVPPHLLEAAHRATDVRDIELRSTPGRVELRTGSGREIGGYAALFNSDSRALPYIERIAPSFFSKSRADGWPGAGGAGVVCRFNHEDSMLLGTTRANTLRLTVDGRGLDYLVDVPLSREDVLELVHRGDVNQSSFAFVSLQEDWGHTSDGTPQRTLLEGRLIDVAPVINAAYPSATVGLRHLAEVRGIPEDDVLELAEQRQLRKLFIRTDIDGGLPMRQMTPAQRKAYVLGRRWPQQRRPMSPAQAKLHLLAKRADDPVMPRVATPDPQRAKLRIRAQRMASGW